MNDAEFEGGYRNEALRLASKTGVALLEDKSYARLTEDDLRDQGIIPSGQVFADFLIENLGLNRSLQTEAMARLTWQIPSPIDTQVVHRALAGKVLSPNEELDIRRSAFHEQSDLLRSLSEKADKRFFALQVLENAGILQEDGDSSFDPENIRANPKLVEECIRQEPTTIRTEKGRYFALLVPRSSTGGLEGYLFTIMPSHIGEYIVVTDPHKNSELSTYLFSQPDLLRYYLAEALKGIQSEMRLALGQEFSKAALNKYERVNKEVEQINSPLSIHVFNLLMKDARNKRGAIIIDIFRDDDDVAAMKGESSPKKDRIGLESGARVFEVQTEEDRLALSWDDKDVIWEEGEQDGMRTRKMVYIPARFKAYVRKNSAQTSLEYGVQDEAGDIVWETDETRFGKASKVRSLFENIKAISMEQRLKLGEAGVREAKRVIGQLLKTQSSVEFFDQAKDFGISDYPATEIIVDINRRLHYVTDQFPKNPPSETGKN